MAQPQQNPGTANLRSTLFPTPPPLGASTPPTTTLTPPPSMLLPPGSAQPQRPASQNLGASPLPASITTLASSSSSSVAGASPSPSGSSVSAAHQAPSAKKVVLAQLQSSETALFQSLQSAPPPEKYAQLIHIPSNDLVIQTEKRAIRTVQHSVTPDVSVPGLEKFAVDTLATFTQDWLVLHHSYEQFDGTLPRIYKVENDVLPAEDNPATETAGDEITLDLLRNITPDIKKHYTGIRRSNRSETFRYFTAKNRRDQEQPSDGRRKLPPAAPPEQIHLVLEMGEASLTIPPPQLEPLFLSLTLFDVAGQRRLSETFYFDSNDPSIMSLLSGARQTSEADRHFRSVVLTLPLNTTLDDVYLLIRIDRVLRGEDLDDAIEPYLKGGQMKPKEREKLLAEIHYACSRLGPYHQPMAYAFLPLCGDDGQLQTRVQQSSAWQKWKHTMSDRELCETYFRERERDRKTGEKKKSDRKILPGNLRFEVRRLQNNEELNSLPNRVDVSLAAVRAVNEKKGATALMVRELQPFYLPQEYLYPWQHYVNNLYLYPELINMTKHRDSDARNLVVKVKLLESDANPEADGLPAIYGRTSNPKGLAHDWLSTVAYHERKANNMDEVKLKLPSRLTAHTHVLFTFYHLTCQTKNPPKEKEKAKNVKPPDALLGYAVLPLYAPNLELGRATARVIGNEVHQLPVALHLPPKYLSPEADAQCKWIDNKRPYFTVRSELVSSLYPQDDRINQLFHLCAVGHDNLELHAAIQGLEGVEPPVLVRCFPVIINTLLHVMQKYSEQTAREAFGALIYVVDKITSLNPFAVAKMAHRPELLVAYVDYQLSLSTLHTAAASAAPTAPTTHSMGPPSPRPQHPTTAPLRQLHEEICRCMATAFRENNPRLSLLVRHSWFFFELMIKCMALHAQADLAKPMQRDKRYREEFLGNLRRLLGSIFSEIFAPKVATLTMAPDLAHIISLFLKDLLSLAPRAFAIEQVYAFVDGISQVHEQILQSMFKFDLLRVIADHEQFVPLNLPQLFKFNSVLTLTDEFWQKHALAGLVLNEIMHSLRGSEKVLIRRALVQLRELFWKHDLDSRYTDPESRAYISAMYFPFFPFSVQNTPLLAKLDLEDRRDWLICCLYVLRNVPRKALLREWWKQETTRTALQLLDLLALALDICEEWKEPNLYKEVTLTVLDVLEDFLEDFRTDLKEAAETDMLEKVVDLFCSFFETSRGKAPAQTPQSVTALSSIFRSLQVFVTDFRKAFFVGKNTSLVGDLLYHVFQYCCVPHSRTRAEATALVYLLMRTNWEECRNFSRTKLQLTVAISKLAGEGKVRDSVHAGKSLQAIAKIGLKEFPDANGLGKQIQALTQRLMKLIDDSIRIAEYKFDPEMTADLYYQVAVSYVDSPDLRVTWMVNLAQQHKASENRLEMAQCNILIAALVSEYLHTVLKGLDTGGVVPPDSAPFRAIAPNLRTEPQLPHLAVSEMEEGVYNPKTFSRAGYLAQLETAVRLLKEADLFENVLDVQDLAIEYLQHQRDYTKLSAAFLDMHNVANKLVEANSKQARLFWNYYRVAFFGRGMKDLDGKEFVYKEPMMVRLADITDRLKAQFAKKFGKVVHLPNAPVERGKLDDNGNTCFFQVVSVQEYFEPEELAERTTLYDKKHNLKTFIYETPFTKGGKSQAADLTEQYKRKTILTTELFFPYIKKRLLITQKREIELIPLENAIDIITDRNRATRNEVSLEPANLKTLQIVLQGSVLAQVNSGPLEIAKLFLGNAAQYPPDLVAKLRGVFAEFLILNAEALRKNKSLIDANQEAFQTQCELSYAKIKREVQFYVQGGTAEQFQAQQLHSSFDNTPGARGSGSGPRSATPTPTPMSSSASSVAAAPSPVLAGSSSGGGAGARGGTPTGSPSTQSLAGSSGSGKPPARHS